MFQYNPKAKTVRVSNFRINRDSIQQGKCLTDIQRNLELDEVLITQDWAMKFLPEKYRETQADWFGKRAVSWQISVAVIETANGKVPLPHIGTHTTNNTQSGTYKIFSKSK